MRTLSIEFAQYRPGTSWATWAAISLALLTLFASLAHYIDRRGEFDRLQTAIAAAQAAHQPPRRALPAKPGLALAEAQVRAINAAVEQLNLPWSGIFRLIEAAKPDNVALLALEPDGKKHLIRIQAEAKTAQHMLAFVDQLRAQPEVDTAYLIKHEINDRDPNKPYRFAAELRWHGDL